MENNILYLTLLITSLLMLLSKTMSFNTIVSENRTLVSRDGTFELGFFSLASSRSRYLGIWYKNIPVKTYVWVANRENPIQNSSGVLMINGTGHLVLLESQKKYGVVWSAKQSKATLSSTLELLDNGNLVLRDGNSEKYLWQSFDYPSDTLLPGMKLGWDLRTGLERRLSSWKSLNEDPSAGDFTWGIEKLHGYAELVMRRGSTEYYRSGPWNGAGFSGAPELKRNPLFDYEFVSNETEIYYLFNLRNKSVLSRIVMNQANYLRERYIWNSKIQAWELFASVPRDNCDKYSLCGPYGNCIIGESPICQCLKGFKPKSPDKVLMDWSEGCVRNKPLECEEGSRDNKAGFLRLVGLKLPDSEYSWVDKSLNLRECRDKCLKNCSCMAYANSDIRGKGSGCALWFRDLVDIRQFPGTGGQDLYVRLHNSELEKDKRKVIKIAVIVLSLLVVVFGLSLLGHYIRRYRRASRGERRAREISSYNNNGDDQTAANFELPLFDLSTIANATDQFSSSNKVGEGGFGPVYKGTLEDGQEIAVKRLSKSSGQGLNEFKNEVNLIAKLQHRNLVRLLGCCIEREEKLLVYEYMPNKSLDFFIFDQRRGKLLDWPKRFRIICAVARGLLYLHQDSRLRIIHRDLKASNILLDKEMNPKISDFGMAKTVIGDQSEGNTKRVVGTYGYMAPEYAIDGLFSMKSDVFSFGILLLEIITGKKNKGFYHLDTGLNLIRHAWRSWKEGRPLEVMDPCLEVSIDESEVLHSIHVGLLCVQEHPEDRPSMSDVVVMLSNTNSSVLPQPKQPAFSLGKDTIGAESSSSKHGFSSTNEITVTRLEPR